VFEDDLTAILSWQGGIMDNYIVRWGPADFSANVTSYWSDKTFQIQPMVAGKQYFAQVASGSVDWRTLGNWSDWSEAVLFQSNPSRVDALRVSAAFFDDFNKLSPGGLDAKSWNTLHSYCNDPDATATFINSQNHAHNLVKGGYRCDSAATTARPRHMIDFSSPQQIFFDFDFGVQGAYWFLDFNAMEHFELSPRLTEAVGSVPGTVGVNTKTFFFLHQHGRIVDLMVGGKNISTTLPMSLIPNVRKRVVIDIAPTSFKLTIDDVVVLDALTVAFPFTVATLGFRQTRNKRVTSRNGTPNWSTVHWDNFGFTSNQKITTEVHDYQWKPTSIYQLVGNGLTDNVLQVTIPDSLQGAVAARLMYHVVPTTASPWSRWDNVTLNGKPIFMFNQSYWRRPKDDWVLKQAGNIPSPVNFLIPLDPADLATGVNTIEFNLRSQYQVGQLHIEFDFPLDNAPLYTQPATWFTLTAPNFHPLSNQKIGLAADIISILNDTTIITQMDENDLPDPEASGVDIVVNATTTTTETPTSTAIQVQAIITQAPGLKPGFVSIVPPLLDQGASYSRAALAASRSKPGVLPIRFRVENTRIKQAFGKVVPIAKVELLLNNATVASWPMTAPYSLLRFSSIYDLDISSIPNGNYEVFVRAYDSEGTPSFPSYNFVTEKFNAGDYVPVRFSLIP
jgi:hypothetical protein